MTQKGRLLGEHIEFLRVFQWLLLWADFALLRYHHEVIIQGWPGFWAKRGIQIIVHLLLFLLGLWVFDWHFFNFHVLFDHIALLILLVAKHEPIEERRNALLLTLIPRDVIVIGMLLNY